MSHFLGIRYYGYRMQSNAMTELMAADIPHVDYSDKKKSVSKEDINAWEKDMENIKNLRPQKINLNDFIIDGTLRNT